MTIPQGYSHVMHYFRGAALPRGAAVTYGILNLVGQTPSQVAEALHDAWGDTMLTLQASVVSLEETHVKFGPDATGAIGSFSQVRNGGRAVAVVTPNAAVLVRKRTAQGGRASRGRFYVPGAPEAEIDSGGFLSPAYLADCQLQCNAFWIRLSNDTGGMVIHHGPDKNNYTPAPFDVTSLSPDDRCATQRRRLRG